MEEASVFKASPTVRTEEAVEDAVLRVEGDIETETRPLSYPEGMDTFYEDQADKVLSVLNHLPQGTRWRVLRKMMRDASCFYMG